MRVRVTGVLRLRLLERGGRHAIQVHARGKRSTSREKIKECVISEGNPDLESWLEGGQRLVVPWSMINFCGLWAVGTNGE